MSSLCEYIMASDSFQTVCSTSMFTEHGSDRCPGVAGYASLRHEVTTGKQNGGIITVVTREHWPPGLSLSVLMYEGREDRDRLNCSMGYDIHSRDQCQASKLAQANVESRCSLKSFTTTLSLHSTPLHHLQTCSRRKTTSIGASEFMQKLSR